MKTNLIKIYFALILVFVGAKPCHSQNFVNLNFDQSIITSSSPTPYGFDSGMANVPGWTSYNFIGAANYAGGTSLLYNNQPLDSPGGGLEGTNYWTPSIQGAYSILIGGGSYAGGIYTGTTNGSSIGQTGQIPPTAQTLIYWGASDNSLQISFNGQMLSFGVISNTASYTIYGANISAFAGQTGELLFNAPWQTGGAIIDNIQFSSSPIPEPRAVALGALGGLILTFRRWQVSNRAG